LTLGHEGEKLHTKQNNVDSNQAGLVAEALTEQNGVVSMEMCLKRKMLFRLSLETA